MARTIRKHQASSEAQKPEPPWSFTGPPAINIQDRDCDRRNSAGSLKRKRRNREGHADFNWRFERLFPTPHPQGGQTGDTQADKRISGRLGHRDNEPTHLAATIVRGMDVDIILAVEKIGDLRGGQEDGC